MDLYENNFLRLRRLISDLPSMPSHAVSSLHGCLSLHMDILEQTKFTTTLRLTYYFDDDNSAEKIAEPELTLRVYHDANQVEVLTGHLRHGRLHFTNIPSETVRVKWQLNRFLYKWLGYCLYLGHAFTLESSSSENTGTIAAAHARGESTTDLIKT